MNYCKYCGNKINQILPLLKIILSAITIATLIGYELEVVIPDKINSIEFYICIILLIINILLTIINTQKKE